MRNFLYKFFNIFSPVFDSLSKNRLRVLAYHDIIDSTTFEAQVIWLKSKYSIIDIQALKDHLYNGKSLPPNSLLITFDDGDRSVFTNGLSIFKKHQISSCLFIITDLINSNKDFWWDIIKKNEKQNGLSQAEIIKIINYNKSIPNEQRIQYLKKYPATFKPQLTIDEIRELEKFGVYIANHSHSHPMFNKLNKVELLNELDQTNIFFNKYQIGDYAVFAYPNGNYSETTEHLLKQNNIHIAFLFDHNINEKKINPLRISRIAVDSDNPLPEFKTKVSGLHPLIFKIKKQYFKIIQEFYL